MQKVVLQLQSKKIVPDSQVLNTEAAVNTSLQLHTVLGLVSMANVS